MMAQTNRRIISAALCVLLSTWWSALSPQIPLLSCQQFLHKVDLACGHAERLNGDQAQVIADLPALFLSLKSIENIYYEYVRKHARQPELRTLGSQENKELYDVVASCAKKLGIPVPHIMIAHDPLFATAATAGLDQSTSILLLGEGVTSKDSPQELEAMIMHELAHIAHDDVANSIFLRLALQLLLILFLLLLLGGFLWFTQQLTWLGVTTVSFVFASMLYVQPRVMSLADRLSDRYMYQCELVADTVAHKHTSTATMNGLFERLESIQNAQQQAHARMFDHAADYLDEMAEAWPKLKQVLLLELSRHRAQTDREFAQRFASHPSWKVRHDKIAQD